MADIANELLSSQPHGPPDPKIPRIDSGLAGSSSALPLTTQQQQLQQQQQQQQMYDSLSKAELITMMKTMTDSMATMTSMAQHIGASVAAQPVAPPPGLDTKKELPLHPKFLEELEREAKELEKNIRLNVRATKRVEAVQDDLRAMKDEAQLPKHVRPYNPPFESTVLDTPFSEHEESFPFVLPAGTTMRVGMKLAHLHFHQTIKSLELRHQTIIRDRSSECASMDSFILKVRAMQMEYNSDMGSLSRDVPKFCTCQTVAADKAREIWRKRFDSVEKSVVLDMKNAENKRKAEEKNQTKAESLNPTSALKSFVLDTFKQASYDANANTEEQEGDEFSDMAVDLQDPSQLAKHLVSKLDELAQDKATKQDNRVQDDQNHKKILASLGRADATTIDKGKGKSKDKGKGKGKGADNNKGKGKGKPVPESGNSGWPKNSKSPTGGWGQNQQQKSATYAAQQNKGKGKAKGKFSTKGRGKGNDSKGGGKGRK